MNLFANESTRYSEQEEKRIKQEIVQSFFSFEKISHSLFKPDNWRWGAKYFKLITSVTCDREPESEGDPETSVPEFQRSIPNFPFENACDAITWFNQDKSEEELAHLLRRIHRLFERLQDYNEDFIDTATRFCIQASIAHDRGRIDTSFRVKGEFYESSDHTILYGNRAPPILINHHWLQNAVAKIQAIRTEIARQSHFRVEISYWIHRLDPEIREVHNTWDTDMVYGFSRYPSEPN